MEPLKVVTVVGTRPEIIRLSRVIERLDQSESIDHVLVHTGQNYDYTLNQIFFEELEVPAPDYFLEAAKDTAAQTIGEIISKMDILLEKIQPDAVLVLGDTNSCLSAIPAKKRKIPIFHMEAGNRCFDQRVPEEINRMIVDHIADINLTYSNISREYLLREGLSPDQIIKTGSPMYEVLQHFLPLIQSSNILDELDLKEKKYFVVSAHREENINNKINFSALISSLNEIATIYNFPIIVSTHPRTQKQIEVEKIELHSNIQLLPPQGFFAYVRLQQKAYAVLSDSGTISEESSILNFRALNIRQAHERPEAMEETAVMMVGLEKNRIIQGLKTLESQSRTSRSFQMVSDYEKPNVSLKVERILISYVDYVNRKVWQKEF
ncbi:MAG: UDP-N-acetylglucosamine 2-epimerase (non-hydrolyzing) [Candidatus Endolissoclinum sp. TMED37]|nr:MAG: UDP-N-acetylglucosamine 2-epimerase (non-hydrolyzing) [Candidatus Endolissoclinum sp. TMED37]